jgi:histone deacetylase complex subunit SAP18
MASEKPIDRQTTCPFLLKFCYRSNGYHPLSDFPLPPVTTLPSHLQIYTWQSCTLRELAQLLTTALPNILPDPAVGTRLSFRLVYPDTRPPPGGGGRLDDAVRGRYMSKEMGSVVVSPQEEGHANGNGDAAGGYNLDGEDAEKTLADARFVIGDFVDCAVFPPLSDGSVVPRTGMGMRGGGPPRENGYRGGRGGFDRGGGGMRAFGGGRGDNFGATIPSGEWRRGERLPDGGYRGGGGGGGFGGGRGGRRGGY